MVGAVAALPLLPLLPKTPGKTRKPVGKLACVEKFWGCHLIKCRDYKVYCDCARSLQSS